MRGVPNFRAAGAGPRIKPRTCCPVASPYLYIDPYFDPDFWQNAYHTFQVRGISSKIPIQFSYPTEFAAKSSVAYYKITTTQETYAGNDSPDNQGFSEATKGMIVNINNGEYLSVSLNSGLIGLDADYAIMEITINVPTGSVLVLASYTLELYAP